MKRNVKTKHKFIKGKVDNLQVGDEFRTLKKKLNCSHHYKVKHIESRFEFLLGHEKKIYIEATVLKEECHLYGCGHHLGESFSLWEFDEEVLILK